MGTRDMKVEKFLPIALTLLILTSILTAQDFDVVEFSNPYKYGWLNEYSRLAARDSLFINSMMLDEYNDRMQSPLLNALKTAVAPGWGHFSVGSYTKGQLLLGSQIVLFGTSFYYREQAMIDYRKYKNATQIDDINNFYNSAVTPYRQSNLLLGLFFVIWGYTIYDSVIETHDYNNNLWYQLKEERTTYKISLTPTSISVRF